MQYHVRLVLCLLLGTLPVAATGGGDLDTRLQQVLGEFLAENPVAPGVVACILGPGPDRCWAGAAGAAVRGDGRSLTPDHTFRIASNTKTYVAAAVLRLAEEGRLGLDDPLARHLPPDIAAILAADGYDLESMTVRMVLSHTSGLFEHPADPRYAAAILADPHHVWTATEQIRRCVEWGGPVGQPGEKFSYSDTGYILLGLIVEQKTARSLGAAVRDLLDFPTLGLDATWWEIMETPPPGAGPRAHQYYGDLDTFGWHPSLDLYGGGGLVSDAEDLARFTRSLLAGDVLQRESTLTAMTGSGTPAYRLGLAATDLEGRLAWGHTGFWNTFVFHLPSLDMTVAGCVLNHHGLEGRELARRLVAAAVAARE
jgi:D-alanyl-D-alanine carboxypeptidase